MQDKWTQRAPWTGIVSVALIVVAFIVAGESPDFDASTKEVFNFYNGDQTAQVIASIALIYGAILLVFFAATLRSALRGSEALSTLVLVGGALEALGMTIFAGLTFTLADLANSDHPARIDPGTLQSLNALNSDLFFPLVIGTAILLLSAGLAILRAGALPRWMGWAALVLGIITVTPLGFFAFLVSGLWIIAAAVLLLQAGRAAPAPGAGAGAAGAP
jgi:hypothetical protein